MPLSLLNVFKLIFNNQSNHSKMFHNSESSHEGHKCLDYYAVHYYAKTSHFSFKNEISLFLSGKPGNFFGMLAKRLASVSKKFLVLLARARLGKCVFFLRSFELKKVRFSLQQHELSKVHRCKGAPFGLNMSE